MKRIKLFGKRYVIFEEENYKYKCWLNQATMINCIRDFLGFYKDSKDERYLKSIEDWTNELKRMIDDVYPITD